MNLIFNFKKHILIIIIITPLPPLRFHHNHHHSHHQINCYWRHYHHHSTVITVIILQPSSSLSQLLSLFHPSPPINLKIELMIDLVKILGLQSNQQVTNEDQIRNIDIKTLQGLGEPITRTCATTIRKNLKPNGGDFH